MKSQDQLTNYTNFMKYRTLINITIYAVLSCASIIADPASDVQIMVSITGNPNDADVDAARWAVERYNANLPAVNADRAQKELAPLPVLPVTPVAQLRASYQTVLKKVLEESHAAYVEQAARDAIEKNIEDAWKNATAAARQRALAELLGEKVPQK